MLKNVTTEQRLRHIAKRLTDVAYIHMESQRNEENYKGVGRITQTLSPLTLSHGYPSLCVLFSNLGIIDNNMKWMENSNVYVGEIVKWINERGIQGASLFSGTAGIAFAIRIASLDGQYYSKLQRSLDEYLYEQIDKTLAVIKKKKATEMFDYDVVEGLTGIANYLFLIRNDNTSELFIRKILDYLVTLSSYKDYNNYKIPNWHILNEHLFSDHEKGIFKDGILNVGLSHGIAGPLIILSKAYNRGLIVEGHLEAINRIVGDILRLKNHNSNNWGGMININNYIDTNMIINEPSRSAWCYGTPGTAFALLCAAEALNDLELLGLAKQAMLDLIGKEEGLFSPTFCHGYAGITYIYKRFYEKTLDIRFLEESHRLKEKTLEYFNEANSFGFLDIELKDNNLLKLNSIGILQGITGVLLPLLSFEENSPSTWSAAFLLDD
ncbi:lanthionine synthetase C family protein [Alkalihalobacterium elongatum]|uniref:lanthionine synthetase C family protein n=1 Tax=Alkalihalobacterium elongatum TaxID=2675466 RepID=UPI001C1F81B6|nr:lanthionine synthetase C family protein [Alkalihalobacterium elongatum]